MGLNYVWYGQQLNLTINAAARAAIKEACILVEITAKDSIGKVPPPSPPGHAPAAPTGTLKARITHEIDEATMTGRVGTNLEYARRLELGFVGTDSLGRRYNQAPRPYLRPALEKNRAAIKKLFGVK